MSTVLGEFQTSTSGSPKLTLSGVYANNSKVVLAACKVWGGTYGNTNGTVRAVLVDSGSDAAVIANCQLTAGNGSGVNSNVIIEGNPKANILVGNTIIDGTFTGNPIVDNCVYLDNPNTNLFAGANQFIATCKFATAIDGASGGQPVLAGNDYFGCGVGSNYSYLVNENMYSQSGIFSSFASYSPNAFFQSTARLSGGTAENVSSYIGETLLKTYPALQYDLAGKQRPSSGYWNRGCYE